MTFELQEVLTPAARPFQLSFLNVTSCFAIDRKVCGSYHESEAELLDAISVPYHDDVWGGGGTTLGTPTALHQRKWPPRAITGDRLGPTVNLNTTLKKMKLNNFNV